MVDICCIGHITSDKVVTTKGHIFMAGGTSFYFSNAICNMDVTYNLVTAVAQKEIRFVEALRKSGIEVLALPSAFTVYFENIYAEDMNHRRQKVLRVADAFTAAQLKEVNATIYHLGPLLAGDIPMDVIKTLAAKGKVSLDVQGYLRKVENENVTAIDWLEKKEALQYIHTLKANEHEMEVLTGSNDVCIAAKILSAWGVKEVVITLGSFGSVIYAEENFYTIPAFKPSAETDATGCGDTYMAGYLFQRVKGSNYQDAGEFGAAMASLKIQSSGPFTGTYAEVAAFLAKNKTPVKV